MFTYDPTLADQLSRIRFNLGDIAAPGLFPDETYTAILASHTTTTTDDPPITTTDEAAATRDGARGLAAYYATQPTQLADAGSSITWGKRIDQWNRIADGAAGGAQVRQAKGFTIKRGPARDYTTGGGDE